MTVDLNTGERATRKPAYNRSRSDWNDNKTGETRFVTDKDYRGRDTLNGDVCDYDEEMNWVCR